MKIQKSIKPKFRSDGFRKSKQTWYRYSKFISKHFRNPDIARKYNKTFKKLYFLSIRPSDLTLCQLHKDLFKEF